MTKRTSDDLSMDSSTTIETTDGRHHLNGDSDVVSDNNNTILENNNEMAKKVKYSSPELKSRVVHLRNIPADTQEADLIALSAGFGRVTNCLILRGKSLSYFLFYNYFLTKY
jgi:hypothetical protein